MAKQIHRTTPATENHVIQRWEVANATARLALTLSASDLGGVARQADDGSQWSLKSISPTVWRQINPDLNTSTVLATGFGTTRTLASWAAKTANGPMGSNWRLRQMLTKIASIAVAGPAQLRVMQGGDSVAGHIIAGTVTRLKTALGVVGFSTCLGQSNYGSLTQTVTGDCNLLATNTDFTRFAHGSYVDLGVGGTLRVGKGGAGQYATELKLLYVIEPGAGTFKVETETGGVYTVQAASVNAAGAVGLGVLTYTLAAASYTIRATGLTGRVKLVGASLIDKGHSGVVEQYFGVGGWNLTPSAVALSPGVVDTPDAIMVPWFAAMAPDIFMWESKDAVIAFEQQFDRILGWVQDSNPLVDLLAIGSTPIVEDNLQIACNVAIQAAVTARNGVYWDAHEVEIDYDTALAYGWMNGVDLVHQTTIGNEFQTALFWHELFSGIANMPDPRQVQTDFINVRRVNFKPTADNALLTTSLVYSDAIGADMFWELTRRLCLAEPGGAATPWFQLCATTNPVGYANNSIPVFRTQGLNGGAKVDGPWLHCDGTGSAIMSAASGSADTPSGFAGMPIYLGTPNSAPTIRTGTGTPEGAVSAPVGSLFTRTDGGAGTVLYVKESGGTGANGWVAK